VNISIYAARPENVFHRQAVKLVTRLAEQPDPSAIPCAYEFLRVVTHPRIFDPPSDPEEAIESLERLRKSPSLVMIGDGPAHFRILLKTLRESGATGNLVHDAHIAALCMEHGVSSLYTMDRDFSRFPGLKVTHPF
jgi:toxin-antitoxin system PIN domain toxin